MLVEAPAEAVATGLSSVGSGAGPASPAHDFILVVKKQLGVVFVEIVGFKARKRLEIIIEPFPHIAPQSIELAIAPNAGY